MKYTRKEYSWKIYETDFSVSWISDYEAIREIYPDREVFKISLNDEIVYCETNGNAEILSDNRHVKREIKRILSLCDEFERIYRNY